LLYINDIAVVIRFDLQLLSYIVRVFAVLFLYRFYGE